MDWINEPMEVKENQAIQEAKCPVLDWICTDLCLINCDLCGLYFY